MISLKPCKSPRPDPLWAPSHHSRREESTPDLISHLRARVRSSRSAHATNDAKFHSSTILCRRVSHHILALTLTPACAHATTYRHTEPTFLLVGEGYTFSLAVLYFELPIPPLVSAILDNGTRFHHLPLLRLHFANLTLPGSLQTKTRPLLAGRGDRRRER